MSPYINRGLKFSCTWPIEKLLPHSKVLHSTTGSFWTHQHPISLISAQIETTYTTTYQYIHLSQSIIIISSFNHNSLEVLQDIHAIHQTFISGTRKAQYSCHAPLTIWQPTPFDAVNPQQLYIHNSYISFSSTIATLTWHTINEPASSNFVKPYYIGDIFDTSRINLRLRLAADQQ